MTAPLDSDAEHLAAELANLDLLLLREVVRARRAAGHAADERGLYVSDDELQQILQRPFASPLWHDVPIDGALAELDALVRHDRSELDARITATLALGRTLRLERLVELHRDATPLPSFLKTLLLLALAPELDLRYERIFGWLHDDITRRHPSVQLALDLLCPGPTARLAALHLFAADGPLRRLALLHTDAREPGAPLLRHELRLAPGLTTWLSGQPSIPPALAPVVTRRAPDPALRAALHLSPELASAWDRLHAAALRGELALNVHGPDGAGRRAFATALCGALDRPLLIVDGARSEALDDAAFAGLLAVLARAVRLERAAICWTAFDRQRPALAALQGADLLFLVTHRPWHAAHPAGLHALAELHVPIAELPVRELLWQDALPDVPAGSLRIAADGFRFTPTQIAAAAVSARGVAGAQGLAAPDLPAVLLACRRHATPKLGALAGAVTTPLRWEDLILPDEHREQLREIVRRLHHRTRVLDDWGFGLGGARGLLALFAGAPGTGKTMAAAIVARECARDLYRIDLSQVVSKYIGETEKHLELLFAEAEATDAALFFDEADAIFGKRSPVKDANDRFANIEVGFLLQRIESFPGLVILATNLRKNIDAAFLRRLQVVVEFPTPDLASRARIWAGVWPAGAPVDPSVDPQLLAERFDLSGGHIRNIALSAAYAAAEANSPITLRHVLTAARGEYRKLDKLTREHSFTEPT
ncbi:MAG TPA: ATP-binding protein [Nannocystis sp.]